MPLFIRYTTLAMATLFLQACSSGHLSKNNEAVEPVQQAKIQLSKHSTPLAPFILRGNLVIGPDTQTFTPCGSKSQYWTNLDKDQMGTIGALTDNPYQPIYAELITTLVLPSQSGFDRDFTATLNVKQINFATTENPQRCAQPNRPTQAYGNEPSWSIEFEKDQINYKEIDSEKTLAITSSQLTNEKRIYDFEQGQLTLSKANCSDTMSDTLTGWAAVFTLPSKKQNGCARLSNFDSTLKWVGTYGAKSTQTNAFSVSLELKPDHSAKTYYRYGDAEPKRQESGYWQQINPEQIQVVMTHHQGQRLIAERIFTKQGNSLKATTEKVNGNIYTIVDNGLVLFQSR